MATITKMAIERAEGMLNDKVNALVALYEKQNPAKAKKVTQAERIKIALKDPKWIEYVTAEAQSNYRSSIGVCPDQLADKSPMVAEAIKKANAPDDGRAERIAAFKSELKSKSSEIIDRASLGILSPEDLMKECKSFG